MNRREFGRSGMRVAPLVLGGNVFGWTADEATSFRLLDAFCDAGFNMIDTADVYSNWKEGNSGGESETILGKWLKQRGKRDTVLIATKVGWEMKLTGKGLSKLHITEAVEDSLQRLQTDYIDLYQSHVDDAETPLEETLEAYDSLLAVGKVRAIGASNYTADRLVAALQTSTDRRLPRYQCLQPLYNLYDRSDYETALEPLCLREQIGVITYSSLRSGFLTGKYRSESDAVKSVRGNRAKTYLNERGLRILAALDKVASELDATPASVSLAWLLARPSVTAPIASATSLGQLDELIASTRLKLDSSHLAKLNQASDWSVTEAV